MHLRSSALRSPVAALLASTALALALVATVLLTGPAGGQPGDPRLALPPLQAPGEWFDSQRTITATPVDYAGALAQRQANAAFTAATAADVADLEWELLGPTNIGGRVVDLALIPGRPEDVFVATASGGVWRSTDLGTTFAPAWPADATQALGAMAATPDGTLIVGTGEANPGGGSIVYGGTGIYRSTDLGATWEHVGLPRSGAFGRILVDPSDGETVYAAASGNLFVPGGQRGLYRSTDAGLTWEPLLTPDTDPDDAISGTTGAVDVAVDPSDPDRILVAMWDHHRDPDKRVYAGPGSGLYLSEDGGSTWDLLEEVTLQADPNPDDEYSLAEEVGRIGVSFAPSDPDRVYAIIANTLDGTHGEWFVSDDGGSSFAVQPSSGLAGNNSSYGWWFARIFVDPADADHLYVAGLELIESTDGGASFLAQSVTTAGVLTGVNQGNVHADQHAMVWSTDVPGLVYLGNDGGVYRSTANGTVGTWVNGLRQGWTQHYSVDVDEQTAEYVVTGLQDNLCQMHVGGSAGPTDAAWTKYGLCGDGIVTRIDPADPTTTYYCSQYGGCGRAVAGAPDLRFGMPDDRYGWLADIQFDPTTSSTIYTGGSRVWRSENRGEDWTPLSADLATPDLEQQDPNPGYKLRGVITTIAPHADGRTLWAGTDEGRLWVTRDLTAADGSNDGWALVGDGDGDGFIDPGGMQRLGLPDGAWITSIAVDPVDPEVAYVAFSGFRSGDDAARLFRTADGGETFEAIAGSGPGALPDAPINDVIVVGEQLVVGTDVGVFTTPDGGQTWLTVGDLPASPVIELVHHVPTGTLTAATFGHGIRRTTFTEPAAAPVGLPDLPAASALAGAAPLGS